MWEVVWARFYQQWKRCDCRLYEALIAQIGDEEAESVNVEAEWHAVWMVFQEMR